MAVAATAAVAAAALALGGCAGAGGGNPESAPGGTPVRGGDLVVQIPQDPGSLDQVISGNVSTGVIGHHIFQGLFMVDAKNNPKPVLAKSYERSDDGLHWTFTLRSGLEFSDGTPLTAEDAAASLRYWLHDSSDGQSLEPLVTKLEAPDDTTVTLDLSAPFPVVDLMAGSWGAVVLKAGIAENAPATGFTRDQVVGSGPYKLKSWTTEKIVLTRNDRYEAPEGKASLYTGAQHAYLDTITFTVVGDTDAVANGLSTGLWDVGQPSDEQYERMKSTDGVEVKPRFSDGVINAMYLNMNPGSIMAKQKARDALNLVLDKKAIMTATGGSSDLTTFSGAFAMKGSRLFSDAGRDQFEAHDPQEAKRLFREAGLKKGQKIRFLTTGEFPQFRKWAVLAQDELKKIGIGSTIQAYDFGTMTDKMKSDPSSWDVSPLFDIGLPPIPHASTEVKGLSTQGYDSERMQNLLGDFNAASGEEETRQALDAIQALVWKDKPAIVLYQSEPFVAFTSDLRGYDGTALFFANAWLAR